MRVRISEGSDPQPQLLIDSVWSPENGFADWAVAGPNETLNRGGLQATAALHTAVVLALFTDRRCPDDHPLRKYVGDGDPRGWWGDAVDVRVDLFEDELGSLLWTLERAVLTEDTRRWAQRLAEEALAPLIRQGAVVRIDVQAEARQALNRLNLYVQLYGRDGTRKYEHRFEDIWRQVAT
ncbi:MAG TPA: phage GP46 family protein [Xanthobacteraceae bacterium]|nr:phage GP46 family protein [Xanthobacteraceae bacterium]